MISAAFRARDQATGLVREQVAYVLGMYAYAYGFPLVMMDVTRRVMTAAPSSGEYSAPINQFHRLRDFVDPNFKNVVRISRNSLWATAFDQVRLMDGPAGSGRSRPTARTSTCTTPSNATGSPPGCRCTTTPTAPGPQPDTARPEMTLAELDRRLARIEESVPGAGI